MNIRRVFIVSLFFFIIFLFSIGGLFLYRKQCYLEHFLLQSRGDTVFNMSPQPSIVEKVMTSGQIWRPVQDRARDTVIQIFAQILAIDILEPYKAPTQAAACGSGFFIDNQGYVITNAHVVMGAKTIWAQVPSLGKRIIDLEVVGMSPEHDLALLRVTQDSRDFMGSYLGAIPFLSLGDSDLVRRSDDVLALGYPLGQQSLKSTTGVISGHEHHLIQMSAPINPGSSGGPLLNTKGEVIGVNSAGVTEAQNVGYAIPINILKTIVDDLHTIKILRKPFLGVRFNNGTETLTKFLGNPLPGGCFVIETIAGSPLERAGVMRGDMIYEINGYAVDMFGDMTVPWSEDKISIVDFPLRLAIGDTITLTIYRKGQKKECTVTFGLANLPAIHRIYPGYEEIDYEIFGGMVVQELTVNHVKLLAEHATGLMRYGELRYQQEPVLIITHIFPDTQLYRGRNLPLGATLDEINGTTVRTLADFRSVIKDSATKEYLTISAVDNVTRAAENIFVVLSMDKILEDEPRLARDYRYQLSDTVKEILKIAQVHKNV